jgi:hypothetical protein
MDYFKNEEQDLIKKIEDLKTKATEFKKNNEEIKISQQRDLITENFRKFTYMDLSEESIWAFINSIYPYGEYKKFLQSDPAMDYSKIQRGTIYLNKQFLNIGFYTKASDRNILLERKLINDFAKFNDIRFEDSKDVLSVFITDIKPINLDGNIICNNYVTSDFVPLFF